MFGMSIQSLLSEVFFPRTIVLNGVHHRARTGIFLVHFHNHHADGVYAPQTPPHEIHAASTALYCARE
jgi:hypothetical protein